MFNKLKKVFTPPYEPFELYSVFVTLFIIALIPLLVVELSSPEIIGVTSTPKTKVVTGEVHITSPLTGAVVEGTEDIKIEANDKRDPITAVQLLVDGNVLLTLTNPNVSNSLSISMPFDSTKFKNGNKKITAAIVTKNNPYQASSATQVFVANSDTEPPIINFESLSDGDNLKASPQRLNLSVTDNFAVDKVVFYVDGSVVKTFSSSPYSFNWDTSKLTIGNHKIKVEAWDLNGNLKQSEISVYKPVLAG